MKSEDINRAIQEHLGWKLIPAGQLYPDRWIHDDHSGVWLRAKDFPNYHTDLNAMHDAEKRLDEEQTLTQMMLMLPPPFCDRPSWRGMAMLLQAPASQRAEAFLKTVGKWNDQ